MLNRIRRRKNRLETLESRRLLTTWIHPQVTDAFVIAKDTDQPVELRVVHDVPWQDDFIGQLNYEGDGSLTLSEDGDSLLYQPASGFTGVDTATVVLSESEEQYTIGINVIEPLLAVDDWYQVAVDAPPSALDVLENDGRNSLQLGWGDLDLIIESAVVDGGGVVAIDAESKELVYTPATGFDGVETITYTIGDGTGNTAEGRVQVRVSDETPQTAWPEQASQAWVQEAVNHFQYQFGSKAYDGFDQPWVTTAGFTNDTTGVVTGTNNQLTSVDESDRIKSDGEYLYILSSPDENHSFRNWFPLIDIFTEDGLIQPDDDQPSNEDENLLTVVDIRQPEAPVVVSRRVFNDQVLSLDLTGDRLTVLSSRDSDTVVNVLDTSDPTDLASVWTTVVDGNFDRARRVNDTLYVFTRGYVQHLPELDTSIVQDLRFFETGQEYLNRIRDNMVQLSLPDQTVYDADGNLVDSVNLPLDPSTDPIPRDYNVMNVISFDTSAPTGGAMDWDIVSSSEKVLVTTDSIYITETEYEGGWSFDLQIDGLAVPETPQITTSIERLAIQDDGSIVPSSSGAVPGVLRNSFSIDQYEGRLRVATENSFWNSAEEDAGSNVYVLEESGTELEVVGGVSGLAPGEQIYSVRFAGDRAYVVTFLQVDPLFVIDFTTPTEPEVLGQLKVPGYSQYLHVINDDFLLGVGRDADEETGMYEGLIVSLFDVSDPTNPTVADRYEFEGGRTTFSPFAGVGFDLQDHHAISYFDSQNVLALPVFSRDSVFEENSRPIFEPGDSAVRTLTINTENGINELDWVPFEDSHVNRTLLVDDYLYSISNRELKVTNLLAPDGVINSLTFQREGQNDFVDATVGDPVTFDVMTNDGIESEFFELVGAELIQGQGVVEITEAGQIRFTPETRSLAQQQIRYLARDAAGTLIEAVATVDPDVIWQNPNQRMDVNNDGVNSARDALNIINLLSEHGPISTEELETAIGEAVDGELMYFDTTGDQRLTALDALLVINELGRADTNFAEGEFTTESESEVFDLDFARDSEQESHVRCAHVDDAIASLF